MPSLILAFMKLRKRNLGPILDANGWAVNAKAKINVPFGTSLTGIAKLPPGSPWTLSDKFAEKSSLWPKILLAAFLAWWIYAFLNDDVGRLYRWTDGKYGKPPAEVQKCWTSKKPPTRRRPKTRPLPKKRRPNRGQGAASPAPTPTPKPTATQ